MTLLAKIFFIVGILLELLQLFFKENSKLLLISGIALINISIILFIFDSIESRLNDKRIKNLEKKLNRLIKKSYKDFNVSSLTNYNGISLHQLIRIQKNKENRQGYITDIGNIEKNRASIYLNEKGILFFRIIDSDSETYTINIKERIESFKINQLIYLCCEFGTSADREYSFLRIIINGRELRKLEFENKIDLKIEKLQPMYIGADLNSTNFGNFDLLESVGYSKTLTKNELLKMLDYFNQKENYSVVGFRGNQFMIRNSQGNLIQPNDKHRPLYIKKVSKTHSFVSSTSKVMRGGAVN